MKIKTLPTDEKLLRTPSQKVSRFDGGLRSVCNVLIKIMLANDAVGIAAVQVGLLKQIIVVWDGQIKPVVMINASLVAAEGTQTFEEGCLSIPKKFIKKERYNQIEVSYQDVTGKWHTLSCSGLLSVVIQHELDHQVGRLMIDE